jgi:hypothetical protein
MRGLGILGAGRWFGLLGSLDLARRFENLHFKLRLQFELEWLKARTF